MYWSWNSIYTLALAGQNLKSFTYNDDIAYRQKERHTKVEIGEKMTDKERQRLPVKTGMLSLDIHAVMKYECYTQNFGNPPIKNSHSAK